MLKKILDNYMLNISTCIKLALSSRIRRLFLSKICQHKLLGFVKQRVFQMFIIFSFTDLKVNI